jgi:hypothetical protein
LAGAQVEMNPVLALFVLGDLLEENLGASAIDWYLGYVRDGVATGR